MLNNRQEMFRLTIDLPVYLLEGALKEMDFAIVKRLGVASYSLNKILHMILDKYRENRVQTNAPKTG
jgi:hypothetical protein